MYVEGVRTLKDVVADGSEEMRDSDTKAEGKQNSIQLCRREVVQEFVQCKEREIGSGSVDACLYLYLRKPRSGSLQAPPAWLLLNHSWTFARTLRSATESSGR